MIGSEFFALMASDGWYIPVPLGRNGRGGTHCELVPPDSGLAPRLFNNEASAKAALRWWLRGAVSVSWRRASSFDGDDDWEDWHVEPKPERLERNVAVVSLRIMPYDPNKLRSA